MKIDIKASRVPAFLQFAALLLVASVTASTLAAEEVARVHQTNDGLIHAGGQVFTSWAEYVQSDYFEANGKRCGLPSRTAPPEKANRTNSTDEAAAAVNPLDCSLTSTNPSDAYLPAVNRYIVTVVVHVIQSTGGQGFLSEAQVQSQIDILNEDFLALLGSNGEDGTDVEIEFRLADEDPDGFPSNGITYSTNDAWFNDSGNYWDTLAWDTSRYVNIYTNTAQGNLGYVPALPNGTGIVGSPQDRVVVLWEAFGRNGAIGPPFNQGRTATHEVGHYLGLEHPFGNGCGSISECYTTGDLICDTPPQDTPTNGCFNRNSCGDPDAIDNYMDYSADLCMERFTFEQSLRMRCSLLNYRPDLLTVAPRDCGNGMLDPGEDCDDGNVIVGDGCDAFCIVEGNDCCTTGHGTGCTSPSLEQCVCADDDYCCNTDWDDLCVASVDEFRCGSCGVDGVPLEIAPPDASTPLRFTSLLVLGWDPGERSGALLYNLYRGTIDDVPAGDYGACLYAGLANNGAVDPAIPPAGRGYTYLVTGTNGNGEGGLGSDSRGTMRPNTAPCVVSRTGPLR